MRGEGEGSEQDIAVVAVEDGEHGTTAAVVVESTMPLRKVEEVAVSPPNEFDPGIGAGATTSLPRPQSSASLRSWSSGKRVRAPPPPPQQHGPGRSSSCGSSSPSMSRRSSIASSAVRKRPKGVVGCGCFGDAGRFFCSGGGGDCCQGVWEDPRKRRQMWMWLGFVLMVLFALIFMVIVFSKFSAGFGGGGSSSVEDDIDYDYESTVADEGPDIAKERYRNVKSGVSKRRKAGSSSVLLLVGGRDEERSDSVEVLTSEGACHLVQGFPAPLPEGRTGHVVASVRNSSLVVCGGLTSRSVLSRKCWMYSQGSGANAWKQVPGLRQSVRYAAACAVGGDVLVSGGTDKAGEKTDAVQVLDTRTFTWSRGPSTPQPVWGHCACAVLGGGGKENVVITGGFALRAERSSLKHAYRLHMRSEEWERLPDMGQGRATHGCSTTFYKDGSPVVIVAGGMDEHKQALSSVEILVLGGSRSRWLRLGDTLAPRKMYPAVAVLGNRLTVAAGTNDLGSDLDTVEKFDPKEKKFRPSGRLQWRRADGRSAAVAARWFPNCG